uniref:Uncharacterized protein n=1 Tax=Aegilops tauschii subsp. strangulata TaxID=200361 RepID=A0A452XXN9_AEGTS
MCIWLLFYIFLVSSGISVICTICRSRVTVFAKINMVNLTGLGGPDMAVGSVHIGAQRFGIISKGYPANQLVNARGNEEL